MKKINYLISIFLIVTACGGLSDAKKVLKNEKVSSTDEFLVKKKRTLNIATKFRGNSKARNCSSRK